MVKLTCLYNEFPHLQVHHIVLGNLSKSLARQWKTCLSRICSNYSRIKLFNFAMIFVAHVISLFWTLANHWKAVLGASRMPHWPPEDHEMHGLCHSYSRYNDYNFPYSTQRSMINAPGAGNSQKRCCTFLPFAHFLIFLYVKPVGFWAGISLDLRNLSLKRQSRIAHCGITHCSKTAQLRASSCVV